MGDIEGREVVGFEVRLVGGDGSIDKESRVARAGAAPNNVWGVVVVPRGGFCQEAGGLSRGGEIGGDEAKPLRFVDSSSLCGIRGPTEPWLQRSETYGDVSQGFLKTLNVSSCDHNVGSFLGEQAGHTAAHALRCAGDEDGLQKNQLTVRGENKFRGLHAHPQGIDSCWERRPSCAASYSNPEEYLA